MQTTPARTESAADLRAADVAHCRQVLLRLIDVGADMVEIEHEKARAQAARIAEGYAIAKDVDGTVAIDRMTRSIRRTVALLLRLHEPVKIAAERDRLAARRKIIRDVEDVIGRDAESADEDRAMRSELYERMDAPELDDEIDDREPAEIVAELCRDLGIDWNPGTPLYRRRTPSAVAELWARAAGAVEVVHDG